jgi:hypothetical protein
MAAHVIVPNERDWPVIGDFLAACEEGAIVVSPEIARQFERETGKRIPDDLEETCIEYDFGGEADTLLDWAADMRHMGIDAIREALGLPDRWDEEDRVFDAPCS